MSFFRRRNYRQAFTNLANAGIRKISPARKSAVPKIQDDEWFELQFNPELARAKYRITLPALPSDAVQVSFTGLAGRTNLQQAFSFYQFVSRSCQLDQIVEPRILDFGGGWGRVSRFFLRDTKPESIYIADVLESSIRYLRASFDRSHIIHNRPGPPILELSDEQFDLIYAYSVFSHLSEEYFHAWVNYLLSVLRPGGYLVFTTRGQIFISYLEHLHRDKSKVPEAQQEFVGKLLREVPLPEEIRRRYLNGDFQFYPLGADFLGEAFIPRSYMEKHFAPLLKGFTEEVQNVDQSVVVLRKNQSFFRRRNYRQAFTNLANAGIRKISPARKAESAKPMPRREATDIDKRRIRRAVAQDVIFV